MANTTILTPTESDLDWKKHWSHDTQPIAPVECLLNHLNDGWSPVPRVLAKRYSYGAGRTVHIYHFELHRDGQSIDVPVRGNPVVRRLIADRHLHIILDDESCLNEPALA